MNPKVIQVIPMENYDVYVYFEDGKIVCYNIQHLLEKKVFKPLLDKDVYMNTCTIMNDTLAWDITGNRNSAECIDIAPDMLYDLPEAVEAIA